MMTNGAERFEYPAPLHGDRADAIQQLRRDLMRMVDGLNMLVGRIEDLERAMQGGQQQ